MFLPKKGMLLWPIALFLLALGSCEQPDEDPKLSPNANPNDSGTTDDALSFWVLNEGQFQRANASMGRYDAEARGYQAHLFSQANDRGPGDILQSARFGQGRLFLCMNNSRRIWVVDTGNSQAIRSMEQVPYPQAFEPLNMEKGYATDLYKSYLYVLDWQQGRLLDSIDLKSPAWPMARKGKYLFVGLRPVSLGTPIPEEESNAIAIIDTETDEMIKKVPVFAYPAQTLIGPEGDLWVGCSGQSQQLGDEKPAGIVHMESAPPFKVLSRWEMPDAGLSSFQFSAEQGLFYWQRKGKVYRSKLMSTNIPVAPYQTPQEVVTFAGFGTLPDGGIIVGDALDYVQPGKVYHYDKGGNLVRSFTAGVIPKAFIPQH